MPKNQKVMKTKTLVSPMAFHEIIQDSNVRCVCGHWVLPNVTMPVQISRIQQSLSAVVSGVVVVPAPLSPNLEVETRMEAKLVFLIRRLLFCNQHWEVSKSFQNLLIEVLGLVGYRKKNKLKVLLAV